MASNKLRIYLKAYDHTLLDESAKRIAESAKKSGAVVAGPMPLPTKIRLPIIHHFSRLTLTMV